MRRKCGRDLSWPEPKKDSLAQDAVSLNSLVTRTTDATDLLNDILRAGRGSFWRVSVGIAVIVGLNCISVDVYRVNELGNAAQHLNETSLAVYSQRRVDRDTLSELGARLKGVPTVNTGPMEDIMWGFNRYEPCFMTSRYLSIGWNMNRVNGG